MLTRANLRVSADCGVTNKAKEGTTATHTDDRRGRNAQVCASSGQTDTGRVKLLSSLLASVTSNGNVQEEREPNIYLLHTFNMVRPRQDRE